MSLAKRLLRGRKAWSEPPFWSLDRLSLDSGGVLPDRERIANDFQGYVAGGFKGSSIVFSCVLRRLMVFSEARFQWQRLEKGRPGDLFGDGALSPLENPWPGGTTGDLLAWMETDVSLAGNNFLTFADDQGNWGRAARGPSRRIARMRPDWVTLVLESASGDPLDIDTRVIGYIYEPRGGLDASEKVTLTADEVSHYAPIPDPEARFRGMSWLTPVIREIEADKATTEHKKRFVENGATPQMVVKHETDDEDSFQKFVELFKKNNQGPSNAGKTLFLAGGADATAVGANLAELDFKNVQGAGETRIASAAAVPPVIAGFSEGLQAATYSNYGQARRSFADGTLRPLWRSAAASLSTLVEPPSGARLWYDDRDISFLREDRRDVAEIQWRQAATIRQLVDAGYDAATVVSAVNSEDFAMLQHTGLFSVQLQPAARQNENDPPLPGDGRESN